ncbi:MAG: tRNA 2-thiouridine(34) synthase MnmA [Bacteroidales bacterium]|nr:tRNA 2-thiouridine(34) synthase MnmA [Bacteroidales bacterium]
MKQRVLLAMSGGIDSTVAAILLQNKGYKVIGIYFSLSDKISIDTELPDIADRLKIDLHIIDLRNQFQKEVIAYFVDEYLAGRTPFPCLTCNNKIKWPALMEYAEKLDCSFISTGHYARIAVNNNNYHIQCAADAEKDQSFFLWALPRQVLEKTIFPLGNIEKKEVKRIAMEQGFSLLNLKKESTGPCFIKGNDYRPFLRKKIAERGININDGDFIDCTRKIIGKHKGYPFYTIGQRRGLGLGNAAPAYVKEIIPAQNHVVIGDKKSLYINTFYITHFYFANPEMIKKTNRLKVRIRYRKQETPCRLRAINRSIIEVILAEPLDSVAPGQSAVFYDGDMVAGGGIIGTM